MVSLQQVRKFVGLEAEEATAEPENPGPAMKSVEPPAFVSVGAALELLNRAEDHGPNYDLK